jgi:hypothetical protein
MTSKRLGAPSNSKFRKEVFGPPLILQDEDSARYHLLLERFYTDLKPKDVTEENYVEDIAYWTWELWRWRRMKICLIEATIPAAMVWVMGAPSHMQLADIGNAHDVDAKSRRPIIHEEHLKKTKEVRAEMEQTLAEHGIQFEPASKPVKDFILINDTIRTRAFLEQFDFVERIDRMIATAENRRNACYRELDRYRASIGLAWREKIQNIEAAEFKVIKPRKPRAKVTKKVK